MEKRIYYALDTSGSEASLNIFGDITSFPWVESDVSSYNLSQRLEALGDVSRIDVYINSYGGEVGEGVAIYNALKRHKAKVVTHCEGFAASIASVIFMAGDERIMNEASALMVHNAWTQAVGNANELRKAADDIEKINQLSITAYKTHFTGTDEELQALLDGETWVLPEEAVEYGFATSISKTESDKASQNARASLLDILKGVFKPKDPEPTPVAEPAPQPEPTPEPPENTAIQRLERLFNNITKN